MVGDLEAKMSAIEEIENRGKQKQSQKTNGTPKSATVDANEGNAFKTMNDYLMATNKTGERSARSNKQQGKIVKMDIQ